VRAEARHQLKQDRFSQTTLEAAERTYQWSAEHKTKLTVVVIVVVVVAATCSGAWYYLNQQDQRASLDLNAAIRTLDTPLRQPGTPAQPDFPTFVSPQERATAARKQFQAIVSNYPHTRSADFARYLLGVTEADLGDNASATRDLETESRYHNQDIAALAKLALASVYRNEGRAKQAIDLYQGLIARPTNTVSKVMAQMELAATYQADGQPLEAKRVYQEVQKENPGEVGQMASAKLQQLK